jgi:hypothetical protein
VGIRLEPKGSTSRDLHVIIVGIDIFAEPELKLTFARSDALRIGSTLHANADRYYRSVQVTQLLDLEASPQAILGSLQAAATTAQSGDTIIFSFAGHGIASDNGYFLTPAGFDSADPTNNGLAWSAVAKALGSAKARVVVMLDACHAGRAGAEGLATNEEAASALLQGMRLLCCCWQLPRVDNIAGRGRSGAVEFSRTRWWKCFSPSVLRLISTGTG